MLTLTRNPYKVAGLLLQVLNIERILGNLHALDQSCSTNPYSYCKSGTPGFNNLKMVPKVMSAKYDVSFILFCKEHDLVTLSGVCGEAILLCIF